MTIAIGSSISVFVTANNNDGEQSTVTQEINFRVALMCIIGAAAALAYYLQILCWMVSGARIAANMKRAYFASLFRHEVDDLHTLGIGKITEALSTNTSTLQDVLSQQIGHFIHALTGFLSAFIIAFARNWKLALILSSVLPAIFVPISLMSKQLARNTRSAASSVSEGHTVAAEAFSAVKVVQDMQAESQMAARYKQHLRLARNPLRKKTFWQAAIFSWVFFVLFSSYALAMWEGANFLISDGVDIGVVTNVLFAIILGIISLGRVSRCIHEFAVAASIGEELFGVTSHTADKPEGSLTSPILGHISFRDVTFAYSSRPSDLVLDGLNLDISPRQTTAIVGTSGAGKSTLVSLLQGFIKPLSGQILVDGSPLSSYSARHLRNQIAFLPQEPRFFTMSIYENVRLGLIGTRLEKQPESVQRRLVAEACASVGLAAVIERLPDGYSTLMGTDGLGTAMSGGEKQRLALARALVRDPRVLILDEPTSALDRESESFVQATIERTMGDRTIIIIAHRLDTIRNVGSIAVLGRGNVAERGSHAELVERGGLYASFLRAQDETKQRTARKLENQIDYTASDHEASRGHDKESEKPGKDSYAPGVTQRHTLLDHVWQIVQLNRPESQLLVIGHTASVVSAAVYPVQAYLFAKVIALSASTIGPDFHDSVARYSLLFIAVAVAKGVSSFTASFSLGICCDRMIERARSKGFECTIERNVEWFLRGKYDTAAIIFTLLNQGNHLAGLHSSSLAVFVEIVVSLASTAIFSLILAWKYALVLLSVVPLVFASGYFRLRLIALYSSSVIRWQVQSSQIASESVASLVTIISFNAQNYIRARYDDSVDEATKLTLRRIWRQALLFALTQSFVFLVNALAIWYGTRLVTTEGLGLFQFFAVFIALTFGAQDAGEMLSRVPDLTTATVVAGHFGKLWDTSGSRDKTQELVAATPGPIALRDASFQYRLCDPAVLSRIKMTIRQGQHVAIVGPSGSGKSTLLNILSLVLMPTGGSMTLNDTDTRLLDPATFRVLASTVPQEPTIFAATVRFNLLLGNPRATTAQAIDACRRAGILNFIQSLPDGMDTMLRGGGGGLSVGQKQRFAIARALVRNPHLLLLDEPTASLDAKTAKVVMAALCDGDGTEGGRTVVTVAHTLANVMQADVVYVLKEGRVVESGSPEALRGSSRLFDQFL
ncbi:hypothetical protein DL767_002116 [Monosporascus sp. MG133]|nr:hypothetical protein DL767_002116 [Monosporascus sp. MG133]